MHPSCKHSIPSPAPARRTQPPLRFAPTHQSGASALGWPYDNHTRMRAREPTLLGRSKHGNLARLHRGDAPTAGMTSPPPSESADENGQKPSAANGCASTASSVKVAPSPVPSPITMESKDADGGTPPRARARKKPRLSYEQRVSRIAGAVATILDCVDEDAEREGLRKTPQRYAKVRQFILVASRLPSPHSSSDARTRNPRRRFCPSRRGTRRRPRTSSAPPSSPSRGRRR